MPTTKTRKAEPSPPPTLADIARRKLTERLTEYRSLVTRAAGGESLTESDMERAAELLEALSLPTFALERDIGGAKTYAQVTRSQAEHEAGNAAAEARVQEVRQRMTALDAEARALKGELHQLATIRSQTLVEYTRRRHELETMHPHVLGDIDAAVTMRLDQQRKRHEGIGWSAT